MFLWENQTKVGLKFRGGKSKSCNCWRRKSDQGGIEIRTTTTTRLSSCPEKIRPRWDWNIKNPRKAPNINAARKSDQGGIEMTSFAGLNNALGNEKIRPRWDWNRPTSFARTPCQNRENQTKVGLKSNTSFTSSAPPTEKIRPRWDWNYKEEIKKLGGQWLEKIRPRWDWNLSADCRVVRAIREKIRPRWDWNIASAINVETCIVRENQTKVGLK